MKKVFILVVLLFGTYLFCQAKDSTNITIEPKEVDCCLIVQFAIANEAKINVKIINKKDNSVIQEKEFVSTNFVDKFDMYLNDISISS